MEANQSTEDESSEKSTPEESKQNLSKSEMAMEFLKSHGVKERKEKGVTKLMQLTAKQVEEMKRLKQMQEDKKTD